MGGCDLSRAAWLACLVVGRERASLCSPYINMYRQSAKVKRIRSGCCVGGGLVGSCGWLVVVVVGVSTGAGGVQG